MGFWLGGWMHLSFSDIDNWIFDLDLTLYGPEANIMAQVRDRIALYVERFFNIDSDAAHQIRHAYWKKYGTTLGGLMTEHAVDPHGYLDFVHDVDPIAACRRFARPDRGFTGAQADFHERRCALCAAGSDRARP